MSTDEINDKEMLKLGNDYKEQKDYDNMKKYYLLAIKNKNIEAMYCMSNYYKEQNDTINMMKYYLLACETSDPKNAYKNYKKGMKDIYGF